MQTAISTVGVDFTSVSYIEFWLYNDAAKSAENAGVNLVFDLGQVNEDAVVGARFDVRGASNDTTYRGRQYVGVGVLNTERQSSGVFNAQTDDIGILGDIRRSCCPISRPTRRSPSARRSWGHRCRYSLGDLSARCTGVTASWIPRT
jgi:hypothetical protein